MKAQKLIYGLIIGSLATITACGSGHQVRVKAAVEAGEYATAPIPLKDYEPISLVFAKTDLKATGKNSPALLYHELMVKAHELGAHDIINVKIESVTNCEKNEDKNSCKTTRYGSALAIKYTKVLEQGTVVSSQATAANLKADTDWENLE